MTKCEICLGEGCSDVVVTDASPGGVAAESPLALAASLALRRSFSSLRWTAGGGGRGANGRFQISWGACCMNARPSSLLIRKASWTYLPSRDQKI